jgi:membrane associated rhomboid family serine protease
MSNFRYYQPGQFPPVVKNILIINVLIFIAQETFGAKSPDIDNLFALHDVRSIYFKPYQLLTYMFMHGSFGHILFNMLAVWMFGSTLENHWGGKRFLQYYIISGLGAAVLHLGVLYIELTPYWDLLRSAPVADQLEIIRSSTNGLSRILNGSTVGASGAVFGCLVAFGYLFPNTLIYVYFLIPIKAKWFVIIYGALELVLGVRNSAGDNVAHFAHLGGALTGIILLLIWNKTNRKTLY